MKAKLVSENLNFTRQSDPKTTMNLGDNARVRRFINKVANDHISDWSTWEEEDFANTGINIRMFLEHLPKNLKYIHSKGMKIDEIRFKSLDQSRFPKEQDDNVDELGYYNE